MPAVPILPLGCLVVDEGKTIGIIELGNKFAEKPLLTDKSCHIDPDGMAIEYEKLYQRAVLPAIGISFCFVGCQQRIYLQECLRSVCKFV